MNCHGSASNQRQAHREPMTRENRITLGWFIPGILAFLVARVPPVEQTVWNVVLQLLGIVLVTIGCVALYRNRRSPGA